MRKTLVIIAVAAAFCSLAACAPRSPAIPDEGEGASGAIQSEDGLKTAPVDESPPDTEDAGRAEPRAFEQSETRSAQEELPLELGRYSTGIYDYSRGRLRNLKLACQACEGVTVGPGEEFSFNGTVGPRTAERGYKEAFIFVGEEKEKQLGGGICQLSSTLYQAALAAGMEITERHVHSQPVDYIDEGLDATIYYGSLDFKFVNSSKWPIQLSAMLADDAVTVSITAIEI